MDNGVILPKHNDPMFLLHLERGNMHFFCVPTHPSNGNLNPSSAEPLKDCQYPEVQKVFSKESFEEFQIALREFVSNPRDFHRDHDSQMAYVMHQANTLITNATMVIDVLNDNLKYMEQVRQAVQREITKLKLLGETPEEW
jgi:hypothetical protein